jgi:hypothetical protein
MFIRKVTSGVAILVVGLMVLGGGLVLRQHFGTGEEPAPLVAASAPPKTLEDKAAPVTVSQPVQREFAPYEDFTGRLEAGPGGPGAAAVLRAPTLRVRFDIDERSYLRYQRLLRAGQVKGSGAPLAVALGDETGFPRVGTLDRFENEVKPDTGTIGVYGDFAECRRPASARHVCPRANELWPPAPRAGSAGRGGLHAPGP